MITRLDHFVLAISDLERGMDEFERLTNVRPAFGGEHVLLGTHNALVSLGNKQYLEVLAPRPGAELHDVFRGVENYEHLTPFRWSVATTNVATTRAQLLDAGFVVKPSIPGERTTADGRTLRWTMLFLDESHDVNAPFFIEWTADTTHPSTTTPTGCSLRSYSVSAIDDERLRQLCAAANLQVAVIQGQPSMQIDLASPAGPVTLRDNGAQGTAIS